MFFSVWPMGAADDVVFFESDRHVNGVQAEDYVISYPKLPAFCLPICLEWLQSGTELSSLIMKQMPVGPQNDVPPTHKWDWTYLILKPMENSRVSSFQWSYTGFFRDQIIWNLFCEDQTSNKMMYQKPFWLILFLKMVSIVWIKCHFNRSHLYLTFWWSPTPFVKRLILRPRPSFFPPTASPEPLRMGGMPRLRVHHPLHWKVW